MQQLNTLVDIHLFVHFDPRAALCLPRVFAFVIVWYQAHFFLVAASFNFSYLASRAPESLLSPHRERQRSQ